MPIEELAGPAAEVRSAGSGRAGLGGKAEWVWAPVPLEELAGPGAEVRWADLSFALCCPPMLLPHPSAALTLLSNPA